MQQNRFFTSTKTFVYNNQNLLNKTRFVVLINSFLWVFDRKYATCVRDKNYLLLNSFHLKIQGHFDGFFTGLLVEKFVNELIKSFF